jgi:hypothetical protein
MIYTARKKSRATLTGPTAVSLNNNQESSFEDPACGWGLQLDARCLYDS